MSEATSAMPGASFDGYAKVRESGLWGMITLRGDLTNTKLETVLKKICGVNVPEGGQIQTSGRFSVAWMSPDELLLILPYDRAKIAVQTLHKSLKGTHFLAENVSDARAVFQVQGSAAREVLAKLSPADMSAQGLNVAQMRRTRLAQVPAALWMEDADCINVICFRSVATYVFGLLCHASQPGSQVGYM